ncbi:MAG: sn-glycerol-1-phosphate dehydrogenase [Parabacteroides sp.]|nr:sn-glycerol-1-phosphate dehydrogenase [Parabacteroides sp.]MBQ8531587.1 sn-glycerol-1-phosphate dehydrogenase [Parabacteroides sp.]
MDRVKLALENATQTKALLLGKGVLSSIATLFKEQFPGKRAIIVADKTTFEVAGKAVQRFLEEGGVEQDVPFIFDEPDMHAEWKFIERLDVHLAKTEAIAIAVGSGTINDTTKLSSSHNNRRYMTVATAASMDGYTAFGASITKDGAKQTFACAAPQALVADIDVIATAPKDMTASGFGDLFAKVPAGADWIIADGLGVEPIDDLAFSIVQDGLQDALSDPIGARNGEEQALSRLIEGLLLGGFAMQAYPKSSRPASGAEHQFSHLWNMQHHVMENGVTPSHGFQVSIGTLVSLAFYEELMKSDMKSLDIEACVAAWPSLEEAEEKAIEMFKGTDFPMIGATEIKAKYVSKDELREQLSRLVENWDVIKERLAKQLVTVDEAVRRLDAVGAPTKPEQIGISRARLRDSIIEAQHIRRRFTILDLAIRTCKIDEWTNHIFGKDGVWPVN